ncbi:MAG: hypothetical protein EOO41_04775, partial [Methanobacteriota archaeon]
MGKANGSSVSSSSSSSSSSCAAGEGHTAVSVGTSHEKQPRTTDDALYTAVAGALQCDALLELLAVVDEDEEAALLFHANASAVHQASAASASATDRIARVLSRLSGDAHAASGDVQLNRLAGTLTAQLSSTSAVVCAAAERQLSNRNKARVRASCHLSPYRMSFLLIPTDDSDCVVAGAGRLVRSGAPTPLLPRQLTSAPAAPAEQADGPTGRVGAAHALPDDRDLAAGAQKGGHEDGALEEELCVLAQEYGGAPLASAAGAQAAHMTGSTLHRAVPQEAVSACVQLLGEQAVRQVVSITLARAAAQPARASTTGGAASQRQMLQQVETRHDERGSFSMLVGNYSDRSVARRAVRVPAADGKADTAATALPASI